MKRFSPSHQLCALALLLFALAGCGSDQSLPSSPGLIVLSGVVEDGPIKNATVSLRDKENKILTICGLQGTLSCNNILTDDKGGFSLQVPAGTDFTEYIVVAVGGVDIKTGADFTGMEMRTPLALFSDDLTAVVASPLTSLVSELAGQGFTLPDAQERVRNWLALPHGADLMVRPSRPAENIDIQRRALLISKIALEINSVSPGPRPFTRMASEMRTSTMQFIAADATCNPEVMTAFGLEADAQTRVVDMQTLLVAAATIDDAAMSFKSAEWNNIFAANVKQMLSDSITFDAQDSNYKKNLKALAETTLLAAGNEVIPVAGTIPQRIARYILFTYLHSDDNLSSWEKLTLDPALFAKGLILLANDPWVAELARSRSLYSVISPLLLSELPGNDNQRRLAYFYGSDLSPHFAAEQLIGRVYDDTINDAVLLKIIEGKAKAGLVDETRTIIATQMIQSEAKAHAYLALANALINFNRPEEARSSLDFARDLYRYVIERKGVASASSTDVINLLATSSAYSKTGDLLNAQSLLADVAAIAQALGGDALIYGRLITGIKNVADVYIAAGDVEAAKPLIDAMNKYSGQTPSYQGTYKLRIYNWSECAKRYAALDGNRSMVLDIFLNIQELRKVEGSAEALYWTPIVSLVESLYRVGETQTALLLANSIPADAAYKNYRVSAFKLVAIYEALQGPGDLDKAFAIVDDASLLLKDEEKVDLLTYFAANQKNPGIALALINAGLFSDARSALEKVEEILDGMVLSNNLVRIRYGYVKVAELYALMGDTARAARLLKKTAEKIVDDLYTVAVMADIALGYHNINQTSEALTLLNTAAQKLADADPTRYRADATLNLGEAEMAARLYETLINSYATIGEKSRVQKMVNLLLPWAQAIHSAGTGNDSLATKECDYLLRAALSLEEAGDHGAALKILALARDLTVGRMENGLKVYDIVVAKTRLAKCLDVITTYAKLHEYKESLALSLSLDFTTERNQALQTLANAYIDRNDFPESTVATIDSDGDGQPDFFHPLASVEEITASGLILDDDSDGDGIVDTLDFRPLFAD